MRAIYRAAFLAVLLSSCGNGAVSVGNRAYVADTASAFYFQARGHTWLVSTDPGGRVLSWGGHGLYEPSGLLPSPATGNQAIVLFIANRVARRDGGSGESIYMITSSSPLGPFSSPIELLSDQAVDNLCDMADARPVWDGSAWHVFVQAVQGPLGPGCVLTNAAIYEATGPTLRELSWVVQPGTRHARALGASNDGSIGIGEGMQWFYLAPYTSLPDLSFLTVFNTWSYRGPPSYNGADMFAYAGTSPDSLNYWYLEAPAFNPTMGIVYPDAILVGASDDDQTGLAGIAIGSGCIQGQSKYRYGRGLTFYPSVVPNPGPGQDWAAQVAAAGPPITIEGPLASASSDAYGPHMFVPRLARNEHGFLRAIRSDPPTWDTYIYYNDAQINGRSGDDCSGYTRWNTDDQGFSVSHLVIEELDP
jgi:hypothetical protein